MPINKERIKDSVLLPKTNFPMRANLQKKEPEISKFWDEIGLFKKLREKSKDREKFILHYGPPFANGAIHTGHVLTYTIKDIVNKIRQMEGFDAPLVPGWDCHGLPIEWKIEEDLRKKMKNKADMDVIAFIKLCRDFAEKWINVQREGLKRFGICADWENPYTTMAHENEGEIVSKFLEIFMKDYIYRGKKPIMWSIVEQTALAEAEVEYKDHTSDSIYVAFPVKISKIKELSDAACVIWTTTPWTLPANRAICFHKNFTYDLIFVEKIAENTKFNTFFEKKLLIAKDLLEDFCKKIGITKFKIIRQIKGAELTETVCRHPFSQSKKLSEKDKSSQFNYNFDVPLIPGDHVTTEAGTGLVHTAPSHGLEDFLVGKEFDIEMPDIVQGDGFYVENLPLFAGKHIFKVADEICEALQEVGALLALEKITHSYPHSWRSKTPLIYRLTSQWFMNIDKIRGLALSEINKVNWYPKQSINRIRGMVESRPDWCISRQRVWGVPIALLLDKKTMEPLRDHKVNEKIINTIKKEGIEAWHKYSADYFVSEDLAGKYEKVMDTLDVWFDSACTNYFVLEKRNDLKWPADLYLEGYDQHRGWFQSSLIESIVTKGEAPYKNVLSHGFILDQEGKKMSKSLGNVLSSEELLQKYGADLSRLWVISTDVSEDVRIGAEIMTRQEDVYRRFRNTLRYLLGSLNDFEKADEMAYEDLPELEKYILHLLREIDEKFKKYSQNFEFSSFYSDLHIFCSNDLSAFYFDIRKDVLYCDAPKSQKRRSAQTVMNILFQYIVRWLAPVLSFTAEEAWLCYTRLLSEPISSSKIEGAYEEQNKFTEKEIELRKKSNEDEEEEKESIHEKLFLCVEEKWNNKELKEKWERIRLIRRVITTAIEQERFVKAISSSLQAHVTLFVEKEDALLLEKIDLSEISIISQHSMLIAKPQAKTVILDEISNIGAVVTPAKGTKCQRCWKIVENVKENDLCDRCWDVLTRTMD
ncbi:MAG: isoleucine--tRNA ligase [Holosporales bacterium]|jgi:isoleucyl-tRNA synthetase|nr:isoleucine--tRNA ligase [Holosporales bacterium]